MSWIKVYERSRTNAWHCAEKLMPEILPRLLAMPCSIIWWTRRIFMVLGRVFDSKVRITRELRKLEFHNKTQRGLQDLAKLLNPKVRGWLQYYEKISRKSLWPVFYYLHHRMIRWVLNKYKSFKGSKVKAIAWLKRVTRSYPNLFYHWEAGYKLV